MGKSKGGSNGFVFFMQELRKKYPQKYPNMASVTADAGDMWTKMSNEQKQPYADQARRAKGKETVKYTSAGIPISFIQKRANDEMTKEHKMKESIKNMVSLNAESNTTATQMFYFAHVNYYIYHERENKYYPAEIGLCRFNFEDGVIKEENTYHAVIYPGKLPLGFTYEAKRIAEESHQLPFPTGEKNNLEEVWDNIIKFLTELNPREEIPPVYAIKNNDNVIENVFNNLGYEFGYDDNYIKVYSMEFLLFTLRNIKEVVWSTISMSILMLEKDVYDFTKNIACEYHETSDVLKFCSLSFVIRMAYIFCDNICQSLNIQMIPGKHIPANSKMNYYTVTNPQIEKKPKPSKTNNAASSVCHSYDENEDCRSELACSVGFHDKDDDIDRLSERTESVLSVLSSSSYNAALARKTENEGDGWQEQKSKNRNKKTDNVGEGSGVLRRPNMKSQIFSLPDSKSEAGGSIAPRGRGRGFTGK